MKSINILWVDDEIDILKPHIIFLEEKGYNMFTSNNGEDAISMVEDNNYDLIFLDESMPGLSGLETLARIKNIKPSITVIMITKIEEEDLMEEAIASKIDDYLIKPVNPKQILMTIKKHTEKLQLISEKTTQTYQMEFGKIGIQINESIRFQDWVDIYKKLVYWEMELNGSSNNDQMQEILQMQRNEANNAFGKYIKNNYFKWFEKNDGDKPLISPNILKTKVFPQMDKGNRVVLIVLDNLRYDQWKLIYETLKPYYSIESEEVYCSIIPTTTQYARNAIFAGLMPYEIDKILPSMWLNDEEDGGKNEFEEELLARQVGRTGKNYKFTFDKIFNRQGERKILKNYQNLSEANLNVLVYNFIDILSHARTNVDMVKELADDEAAYRSISLSWFNHSYLLMLLKKLSEEKNTKIMITTDHGSIKVTNPVRVIGDKETSTNLRFKAGKNLNYNPKEVFEIKDVKKAHLPERNISYDYIFAYNNDYFVYPKNYNHYVNYFKNTFQHGGISMEEMLIPFVVLNSNE